MLVSIIKCVWGISALTLPFHGQMSLNYHFTGLLQDSLIPGMFCVGLLRVIGISEVTQRFIIKDSVTRWESFRVSMNGMGFTGICLPACNLWLIKAKQTLDPPHIQLHTLDWGFLLNLKHVSEWIQSENISNFFLQRLLVRNVFYQAQTTVYSYQLHQSSSSYVLLLPRTYP